MVHDAQVGTEADGLERVYREEAPRLWRALTGYTGDPEVASDALAEAFAQALARGGEIDSPQAWIWRAAFKIAAGELQRRGRERPSGPEPVTEFPEPIDHVVRALQRISPNQRLAVVLHDCADRPTDEIAAILGASRATVHVHLSQGRRRLRTLLEATDG